VKKISIVIFSVILFFSLFYLFSNMGGEEFNPGLAEDPERCFEELDDRVEQQKCVVTVSGNMDNLEYCGYIEEGFEDFEVVCRARIKGEEDLCEKVVDDELRSRCFDLVLDVVD